MKNLKFLLLSFLLIAGLQINAQTLNEGVITMEITEVGSDNEQVAAQLEMFKGTVTEYSFNKDKSLITADMMGGMIKMKTMVMNETENMTMLFDAMGQKMMIESTKDERKGMEEEMNEKMAELKVTYDESDSKDILGYKCIKATISGNEEMPMEYSMYVSRDIKASHEMIQGLQGVDLNGFPLEYIIKTEQMNMTYTATGLDKKVDPSVFDLNTSGYQKMTFDEFQEQMGAFGGGMGF